MKDCLEAQDLTLIRAAAMPPAGKPLISRAARKRGRQREFRVYFAVIFLAALGPAALKAIYFAIAGNSEQVKNPVSRAWHIASVITPTVFSA